MTRCMSATARSARTAVVTALLAGLLSACNPTAATVAGSTGDGATSAGARPAIQTLPALRDTGFAQLPPGSLLKQLHVRDEEGENVMLLSRQQDVFTDEDGVDQDRITLTATLYRRADADSAWEQTWQQVDPTECPGLDLQAGYFLDQLQATDLDGDGQAEFTVASHAFCGGGIDPHALQLLLVQGDRAYVVEGDSLVQIGEDPPFGGERRDDPGLADAPAALRHHIDQVWAQIKRGPAA